MAKGGARPNAGRPLKSLKLHRLHGTFRRDRHGDRQTPALSPGRPIASGTLAGAALREWERLCFLLEHEGTLTPAHGPMLEQHCRLFAEVENTWREYERLRQVLDTLSPHVAQLEGQAQREASAS